MNGFLSLTNKALSFGDIHPSNDPVRRYFDWSRCLTAIPVANPREQSGVLVAGASVQVFNGTRSLTLDNTTAFGVTLSTLDAGTRYRFTWTGGTNPTLRTDRGLTLNTQSVTISIGANQVADVTLGGGTFGSTAVGDTLFLPGVGTGDSATPFNVLNNGWWTVIGVLSSTHIQVVRPVGTTFSGISETQTVTGNSQVQTFTAAGVQVGDSVSITGGFASTNLSTFQINTVTSTWFEILSAAPLTTQSGITPGTTGIAFFYILKRWSRIEVDQNAVVQINLDATLNNTVQPIVAGDQDQVGWWEKWGPTYQLTIVNQSSASLNYSFLSVE